MRRGQWPWGRMGWPSCAGVAERISQWACRWPRCRPLAPTCLCAARCCRAITLFVVFKCRASLLFVVFKPYLRKPYCPPAG